MKILIATVLLATTLTVHAGPYVDLGLGVPISPHTGYIPDQYAIIGVGYISRVNDLISIDAGLHHRSETGSNHCGDVGEECYGDFGVEVKLRYEW